MVLIVFNKSHTDTPAAKSLSKMEIKVYSWGKKAKAGTVSVQEASLLDLFKASSQVPVFVFLCILGQKDKEDEGQIGHGGVIETLLEDFTGS